MRARALFVLIVMLLAAVASAVAITPSGAAPPPIGTDGWVLSNNSLLPLSTLNPSAAGPPTAVTGLTAGDTLVGIDFRPQNGMLYGLGHNSGAGTVRLYSISFRTGVATLVGAASFVQADGTTPNPVQGTSFGFDFNPAVDRIRVVNDVGQNFRFNPSNGTAIDGDLGAPGTQMDSAINGVATSLDSVAYTNNQPNSTLTTLYTLSAASNQLLIQNPPNNGTQTTPVAVTLDGSPLDFTGANGFDIFPNVNAPAASLPATGVGHAALAVGGTTSLYTIDLTTGVAADLGPIAAGTLPIQGFAVQGEEVPNGLPVIGLGGAGNTLVRFNTATPGTTTTVGVTGLTAGETLVGIDWRPQTGHLMGLGTNAVLDTGTLYLIDPQTAAATSVGAPGSIATVGDLPPADEGYGFDFNPMVDRIRVVAGSGVNFRINPSTGAPVLPPDTDINGLPGGTGLVGAAYTNSYAQAAGGATTLYVLDPTSNMLFIQNPPNAGVVTNGLSLGVNFIAVSGFDIPPEVEVATSGTAATGNAYAALTVAGSSGLYTINLATGAATLVGSFGVGSLAGLTVGDGPVDPLAATTTTLTSDPNPSTVGEAVTFTATISPSGATGTVEFTADGTTIAGCDAETVTGGVATCTSTFDTAGDYDILAIFTPSGAIAPSTSEVLVQTVDAASGSTTTTTTITPGVVTPANTTGTPAALARVDVTPTSGSSLPSTGYDARLLVLGLLLLAGGTSLVMIGSYRRGGAVGA